MTAFQHDDHISLAQSKLQLSNGAELAYFDSAPEAASAPVLVLLHGYCGSSAYWEAIVSELAPEIRVIAPDARGHGRSSSPADEIYTMELYAQDIADMLDQLQVDHAVMLGHSLGGYITLAFAERYAVRLSGFGLIHSTPLEDSGEAKQNRDKAVAAIEEQGLAPFIDGLIPKLFAQHNQNNHQEAIARGKRIGYGTQLEGAIRTAKGMKARVDRTHVIRESKLPVLLVAGANDGIIPVANTFAAANEKTTKAELAEAGHMGMMEQPQQLAAVMRRFVMSI